MKHHIDKISIAKESSILEALKLLDLNGLRIVLVIDDNHILLGSITDGDIRRGLLKGKDLYASVDTIMNNHPFCIEQNAYDFKQVFKLMKAKNLLALPIVNNKKLVDIVTISDLFLREKRDNPVFIMAGGFGTRLRPLTDNCPKPMLPVGGKPLLEIMIQHLKLQGFYKFYISTHYLPKVIEDYFGNGEKFGIEITYVHEETPLGTGGALSLLSKNKINLPFIMINGDVLTNMDFVKLIDFHHKHQAMATMCVREFQYQIPYGVINSENNMITGMVEKPSYHFDINTGIYVVSPELLLQGVQSEFIGMPMILEQQLSIGKKVISYPVHEYWLDIGQMEDYNRAQRDILNLDFGDL